MGLLRGSSVGKVGDRVCLYQDTAPQARYCLQDEGFQAILCKPETWSAASLAQLVEHALRKRMVVGAIPTGIFEEVLIADDGLLNDLIDWLVD